MPYGFIRDWAKGQKPSAGHLNQTLPTVRSLQHVAGRNGIVVSQQTHGTTITGPKITGAMESFFGTIVAKGPNDEADYADARYFVRRGIVDGADANDDEISVSDAVIPKATKYLNGDPTKVPAYDKIVTATSLNELLDDTHTTPVGTIVFVKSIYDKQTAPRKRYFIEEAPPGCVVVKITGNETKGGSYACTVVSSVTAFNPTAAGALSLGTSLTDRSGVYVNSEEDGQDTHLLKAATYAIGRVAGVTSETTPRFIVLGEGGTGRTASPDTLGSASEGSETADTTAWTKSSDDAPVTAYVQTRSVYNEAGDKTLYAMIRAFNFDSRGLLTSIGSETRVSVDVPEECP